MSAQITDTDLGMNAMLKRMQSEATHVDIGIHADEGEELVMIASVHEFGAKIRHPGGTSYGYATAEDAQNGQVRFLKGGMGYKVLGVTEPHEITIPMRSYIRSTVDENAGEYHHLSIDLLQRIQDGSMSKFQALSHIGQRIEADIKRTITTLKSPPNAPSTIRQKGSSNPLIDTGNLRASIRYVVKMADDGAIPI